MFETCLKKQTEVKSWFSECLDSSSKYEKLIQLGRQLPPFPSEARQPDLLVQGCQSKMYLQTTFNGHFIEFRAESDALISAGLAAILVYVYSGETPETILKCPPTYLDEIGIGSSLSPNRANGLYSLHLRMKQEALKELTKKRST